MKGNYVDLTSLLVGARNNQAVALEQLAKKFSEGRFLVPLRTTKGIRNSPETLKEAGTDLPAHYLSLADGRTAAIFFTNYQDLDLAEKELSWRTDNRNLKSLCVPGSLMADHSELLFDAGGIDRVILNPGGPNETHLSQGDIATLDRGQAPFSLAFHAGGIAVPSFLPPSIVESFSDVAFSTAGSLAGSILKKVTEQLETFATQPGVSGQSSFATVSTSTTEPLVIGGASEQLNTVVSQLFAVFSKLPPDESMPALQVTVNKFGDDVQITANRPVPDDLLNEAHQTVKETLAGAGDFQLNLDLSMAPFVGGNGLGTSATVSDLLAAPAWTPPVAAKPTTETTTPPKKSKARTSQRSKAKRRSRKLDYIPLEPESPDKSGE